MALPRTFILYRVRCFVSTLLSRNKPNIKNYFNVSRTILRIVVYWKYLWEMYIKLGARGRSVCLKVDSCIMCDVKLGTFLIARMSAGVCAVKNTALFACKW